MTSIVWEGHALYRNGYPYHLRGCNYGNVPIAQSTTDWTVEYDQLLQDLTDMKDAGINCIKVYINNFSPTTYDPAMAACLAAGIDVIAQYWVSYSLDYTTTTGTTNRTNAINGFTSMIGNLSGYPAVVGYGFGSENNYNLGTTTQLGDWFQLVNNACVAGKAIDSTRFYYTSNGEISSMSLGDQLVPNLDVWGATVYSGTSFGTRFTTIPTYTRKPFIFTEWGTNRYISGIEDPTTQSTDISLKLNSLESNWPIAAGHFLFRFEDRQPTSSPSSIDYWGISSAVAAGNNAVRPKFVAYNAIDTILTSKTFIKDNSGNYIVDNLQNFLVTLV